MGQFHGLPCNLAVNCLFAYETMLMKNFISFSFSDVKGTAHPSGAPEFSLF
jgi:hypothetical protein